MLIHNCRACGFKTKIFNEWFNHLWDKQHQDVSRVTFLKWSEQANEKSLLITIAPGVPPPVPSEILTLFLKHSCLIVDLVYWIKLPRKFVVQFQKREDVEKVFQLSQPEELSIGGQNIWLQKKSEIHSVQWQEMQHSVGNGNKGSNVEEVLIVLSDSDNDNNSEPDDNDVSVTNGGNAVEEIDCDDDHSSITRNGTENQDESSDEDDDPGYSVELVTNMSDDFKSKFLDKACKKKDDKKEVKKSLSQLGSLWIDVFITFNNKLWPCCFMVSNKVTKTNRSDDIGFEAIFICEVLKSKRTKWLDDVPESKREQREVARERLNTFLNVLLNEEACGKRLDYLSTLKSSEEICKKPILKFKCHMIVTYTDTGSAKARMTFEEIQGHKKIKKMNTIIETFKLCFAEFEKIQIKEWTPSKIMYTGTTGNGVKDEDGEVAAKKWTGIEIVIVE